MKPEKITAWALNELPAEEQPEIETVLQSDESIRTEAAEVKSFCDFLTSELKDDSLDLGADHLAALKNLPPANPAKTAPWWRRYAVANVAAAAAVVVISGVMMIKSEKQEAAETVAVVGPEEVIVRQAPVDAKKKEGKEAMVASSAPSFVPLKDAGKPASTVGGFLKADGPAPATAPSLPRLGAKPYTGDLVVRREPLARGQRFGNQPITPGDVGLLIAPGKAGGFDSPEIPQSFGRGYVDSNGANTESYAQIIENTVQDVVRAPLSTFSIDVDTASYANVRRFLNQNTMPPNDAVRIEELVNYFPYNIDGPAAGDKAPFAVVAELSQCPWQPQHRLARIAIKGKESGMEHRNSNLVFLVDVSGSMSDAAKLPLVQQSLRMLTERLGEEDRVSLVVYAGSSGVVLPSTNGLKKQEILAAIDNLNAGGGTHGSAGIRLAYEQAVAGFIKGGVNRVILCTDGDFNVGVTSPVELEQLITEKARSGVFLSVLGYGSGNLQDRTMETLADKGNGNYAYIDNLAEARKVLVEQMQGTLVTIAKDVKIQVEFNPAQVRGYRLIGYENRMLAKEDFNDDTKDAGEIGAGHTVTALYELVPASLPADAEVRPLVDNLKYQNQAVSAPLPPEQLKPAAQKDEVMTVKLRYKKPDGNVSQLIEVPVADTGKALPAASREFKFAASVAAFGLLLRDSAYKGQLTWDNVRQLAREGKGPDANGYRGEFLQLIEKAAALPVR